MRTCLEEAPREDRRAARTPTRLPGWWWLRWRDESDASNTSWTAARTTTQLTPAGGKDCECVCSSGETQETDMMRRTGADVLPVCAEGCFWLVSGPRAGCGSRSSSGRSRVCR